jgi:hypothetical protein
MPRVWTAVLVALLVSTSLAGCDGVSAGPNFATETLDRYFTLKWDVVPAAGGSVVEGYVYNNSALIADRMRLRIDHLDAEGKVVGSSTTWVAGGVPGNSRAWFAAPVPTAARYRVEVLSFDWLGRGGA